MKVSRACHALSIPKRERDIRTSPPSLVVIPIRRRTERDLSDAICALLAADPRIAIARSLAVLRRLGMTSLSAFSPHALHPLHALRHLRGISGLIGSTKGMTRS